MFQSDLFPLLLITFSILSANSLDFHTANCPTFLCGNINIAYPFWIHNKTSPEHCGYPGLGLSCSSNRYNSPVILLSNNASYYVKSIDYNSNIITVVDVDVVEQSCPRTRRNVTLDSTPVLDLKDDQKLTFFFNCSLNPSSKSSLECLSNNTRRSYVFSAKDQIPKLDWYGNCEESVVVPVMAINGLSITGFGPSLQEGFHLIWSSSDNCKVCEKNNGHCWYNQTSSESVCVCPDGRKVRTGSCIPGISPNGKKVLLGASVTVLAIIVLILVLVHRKKLSSYIRNSLWKKKTKYTQNVEAFLDNYGSLALRRYKYLDIKKMTNSFKDKLGQGGYGGVFKGKLVDGRLVAIKVMRNTKGNGEEFINEVATIGTTNHLNIVSLLGFCSEGSKRALVYEFMPNGSLEKFIFAERSSVTHPLGWEKLYQIALGIARGLEYLHRGCNTRILHFDIKPHNILLDHDFCPKISDFGLAKPCPTRESIVSMLGTRGTVGYIAPEVYCRNIGGVSYKSDVYSYGMMVLEIVGGRQNIDPRVENTSEIYFPHWIYNRIEQQGDMKLGVFEQVFQEETAMKMILVGLWCIQTDPGIRPSMTRVVEMLEGSIESVQMPPKPFLDHPSG